MSNNDRSFKEKINDAFANLLRNHDGGISNTSTKKYADLVALFASRLGIATDDVYATGATTRTSNLDTRLAQGNQRKAHTPVGLAFIKHAIDTSSFEADIEDVSNSAEVTCRKFVEGQEGTTYDVLVLLIQANDDEALHVTRVIWSGRKDLVDILVSEFPEATVSNFKRVVLAGPASMDAQKEVARPEPKVIAVEWASANSSGKLGKLVAMEKPIRQATTSLKSGKNIVLMGPPGTGKTELAISLAESLGVPYTLVTATSDWTTFDTIGGYLPAYNLEEKSQTLDFFAAAVASSFEQGKWLIIDELNRADIDKAFGELFTLLSHKSVQLPYKRLVGNRLLDVVLAPPGMPPDENVYQIHMPKNWAMIGTMNTFDKASLYALSYAFMRRFAFINVDVPDPESYSKLIEQSVRNEGSSVSAFLEKCKDMLLALFSGESDDSLNNLGLAVGPAIPLDIVKYLKVADSLETLTEDDALERVVESLEMFLYPQFEGKDRQHVQIGDFLARKLSLSQSAASSTNDILAQWTGFEA